MSAVMITKKEARKQLEQNIKDKYIKLLDTEIKSALKDNKSNYYWQIPDDVRECKMEEYFRSFLNDPERGYAVQSVIKSCTVNCYKCNCYETLAGFKIFW